MTETPTPPPPTGIFVSSLVHGYVLPPHEQQRLLMKKLLHTGDAIPVQMLRHLLTIKLLAPEESRELRIYPYPEIQQFLTTAATALVLRYRGDPT